MRHLALLLLAALPACTLSTDLDRPYPGDPADAQRPDAQPADRGLDASGDDLGPDLDRGPALDGAPPDLALDMAPPDQAVDAAPPGDASAVMDAVPQDGDPPDVAPPCAPGDVRSEPCGTRGRRISRCGPNGWVPDDCRAHLVHPCGAILQAREGDGPWLDTALYIYRPNLDAPAGRYAVAGYERLLCSGCQDGDGPGGRFSLSVERTRGADRRVTGQTTCDLVTDDCGRQATYAEDAPDRLIVRHTDDTGATVQMDRHRIVQGFITQSDIAVDGPAFQERYTYTYAEDGWLDAVQRAGADGQPDQERRYRYGPDGRWQQLLFTQIGDAAPTQRMNFDDTCAACDARGCALTAPPGCEAIPLRGRDNFRGGWPTVACEGGAAGAIQADAAAACAQWEGTLARPDSPVDLAWLSVAAQAVGPNDTFWVQGEVTEDGDALWADGTAVPPGWLAPGGPAPACLALSANGRLVATPCGETRPAFLCERRP